MKIIIYMSMTDKFDLRPPSSNIRQKKSFLRSFQRRFSLLLLYLVSLFYKLPWCASEISICNGIDYMSSMIYSRIIYKNVKIFNLIVFLWRKKVFSVNSDGTMNVWFNVWNFCEAYFHPNHLGQNSNQRLLATTFGISL